jgi:hypothetical protein
MLMRWRIDGIALMTSSTPPPSGAAPPPDAKARRRPATTIDLTATEVESSPAGAAAPAAAQMADSAPEVAPSDAARGAAERPEPQAPKHDSEEQERANAGTARAAAPAQDWRKALSGLRSATPWPLIAAAAAGGLVVFLAFMIAGLGSRSDVGASPLDARLKRVEDTLRELAARPASAGDAQAIADLTGRISRIEAALANPRPAAADPALLNRLSNLEGSLKALGETVAIVARRSDEIAAIARDAQKRADANAAALAELAQKLARSGASAVERSEIDALARRLAALEKTVQGELAKRPAGGSRDQAARAAFAAAALWRALERGDPFAAELAAIKSLAGGEALEPLTPFAASGVPSAATLGRELAALAPALYEAAGAGSRDTGLLQRLRASAEKLVRIRPVAEATPGSEPTSIVARIEAKAARADLAGALDELARLPAAARAPAQDWIKKTEARQAAVAAGRRLAADALAALGS